MKRKEIIAECIEVLQDIGYSELAESLAKLERPFKVSVGTLTASNGVTHVVLLDSFDRPAEAKGYDSIGRIEAFATPSRENADIEAAVWEAFLNGEGDTSNTRARKTLGES